MAHGEAGQLEQALRCFKRALRERPSHAESHYNLGKLHAKLGQTEEAVRSYRRAGQLDPGMGGVPNNLGVLYSRLTASRCTSFFAELSKFVEPNTGAAEAHAELGRRLLAEACFEDGWREYVWRRGASTGQRADPAGKRVLLRPD